MQSGRFPKDRWFKRLTDRDHEHVKKALDAVGMWEMRHKKIGELSGGQKQRISLARVFATDPDLFILDEPTTGFHSEDIKELLVILNRSVDNGDTVIVIEHNLDVIKIADYVIDLGPDGGVGGGTVVAAGTPEEVSKVDASYTGQWLKKYL